MYRVDHIEAGLFRDDILLGFTRHVKREGIEERDIGRYYKAGSKLFVMRSQTYNSPEGGYVLSSLIRPCG